MENKKGAGIIGFVILTLLAIFHNKEILQSICIGGKSWMLNHQQENMSRRPADMDIIKILEMTKNKASDEAARQRGIKSDVQMADSFYFGKGVERDLPLAVKLYRAAAEQGDAYAQCMLGNCYYDGEGVEQDRRAAVRWYHKSAEQGFTRAQRNLAVCYETGEGCERNPQEAARWYQRASAGR